ncbi:MAG: 50S ribosomal protein L21 [Proteobacteria bacterium]|nr:50S ribosomal protein L21 [Pseudomonadota bacterium]NBX86497.1 50S ribosomal protein L21 [Pseudomonadota bacterium]
MYAIVMTGGKQLKVAKGDEIAVEKLDAKVGESVVLDKVLLVAAEGSLKIGTPLLKGASVTAEILQQDKGPKMIAFKKRRRQNSRRKIGHRQPFTLVRVTGIKA